MVSRGGESGRRKGGCRKEWKVFAGADVCAHGNHGGIEKNESGGEGKEVSGLGHVSLTLESPQGSGQGCGKNWMS